jgi:hypothetical protein
MTESLDDPIDMIQGNQAWQNALAQQVKQPLYIFEIPDFGIVIATFSAGASNVTLGGYGATVYGTSGYGT